VRLLGTAICCVALFGAIAEAQTLGGGRTALEAVAAVASTSDAADDPFVWLDFATTVRVTGELDVVVRPYARRLPGGDWDFVVYQAQIRYQPTPQVRVDAGIITSPFGLGALELRPDLNPVVTYPFYYFGQLPAFDQFTNRVGILSGGYPLGAVISWSGNKFDARGAITDGTPARSRDIFETGPSATPQFIAGGGYTPVTGLRIGAGLAAGKYRRSSDADYFGESPTTGPVNDADALLVNVEAEYAVRYTRLSGEWVRDRFNTDAAPAVARGFYVQAVQTLSPRTFAAARLTRATTPVRTSGGLERRARSVAEVTAGYRVTPQVTLKAGYQAARAFGVASWNHTAVWSVVWAQRWF
jgi:hypothetical protein